MYLSVLFFPILNFIILACFGRFIGNIGSFIISILNLFLSLLFSMVIFYEICLSNSIVYLSLFEWMHLGVLGLNIGFLYDSLSVVMLNVVLFISFLVHCYSIHYMKLDAHIIRFLSYLSLFTFMMLLLITANNFFQMFLGWEGVGIASYLLINFWYTRQQANKSALKAIFLNRVGDLGLALGIFLIFFNYKSLDFNIVFSLVNSLHSLNLNFLFFDINIITLISCLLLIGTIGKSAQLGLHMWLPDAMEGCLVGSLKISLYAGISNLNSFWYTQDIFSCSKKSKKEDNPQEEKYYINY
jgi:NADH-quinone oxidoreductase subunit L